MTSPLPRHSTASGDGVRATWDIAGPAPVSRRSDSAWRSHRLATSAIAGPNRNDLVSSTCGAGKPVITSRAARQA